jgi:nitrite reductase (NADH) small subunit
MNWTRITRTENIPEREGRPVTLGDVDIAIFNLGDRFLAIENKCPHQGGPLCDGIVSGTTVVCPLHGWRFDLDTGVPVRASLPDCLTVFPTRVEDGIVMIDVKAGTRLGSQEVAA